MLNRLRALIATFALLIAGCGGGGDSPVPPSPVQPSSEPSASFTLAASAQAGTPVRFDATSSSSPAGSPLTYTWEFGDGALGGSATLARTYAAAGTYAVTLTVRDNAGNAARKTQDIVITAGPAPGPSVQVSGLIQDLANAPVAGVAASVVNGNATASSNANGRLTLIFATGSDVVVKLSKNGYSDQFVPVHLPVTTGADAYFEARLIAREPAQALTDAAAGGTLNGKNGATATFAPASLLDATGRAVAGAVQVSMTPVDVTSSSIATFPGRFQGTSSAGVSTAIVSHGTVEFVLTQNGQRVQLAPGATATIEIPAFSNANADSSALIVGDRVPLWSLDETTGLWTQEGLGAVVASAGSPTGLALRATVGHFSWWNMDAPIDSDFTPKPKCQDAGSGTPGSTDHLANATICNMLAQFDRAGGGGVARAAAGGGTQERFAAAAPPAIRPGYGGTFSIPIGGGVPIALPANTSMTLHANALNGTWVGQATVMGGATNAPTIVIPMSPVAGAPAAQAITLPFDQTLALAASQTSRFSFTAVGNKPVNITVASGAGSSFTGQARLLQGSTVLATTPIALATATLSATTLPAGDYVIEIDNSGVQTATFHLQAAYIHWATQGARQFAKDVRALTLSHDAQGQPVVMASETYNPTPGSAVENTRLVFRQLVGGAWTDLAAPVELGNTRRGTAVPCVGFALDRNGRPGYVLESGNSLLVVYTVNQWNGVAWQTVGPNAGVLPQTQVNDGSDCKSPPSLEFTTGNQPIVGYDVSGQLFVQQFNGATWQGIGPNNGRVTPLLPTNQLFAHSMKLDSTDAPVVMWNTGGNRSTGHAAFVVRFAASPTPVWAGVGPNGGQLPIPAASGLSFLYLEAPRLLLDSNDRPLVAGRLLADSTSPAPFTVGAIVGFKFDGTRWTASDIHQANATGAFVLGTTVLPSPTNERVSALVDGTGQLSVAWTEITDSNNANVRYYVETWPGTGTLWQGLGSTLGVVDNPTQLLTAGIAMARDASGNPALAFVEQVVSGSGGVNVGVSLFVP